VTHGWNQTSQENHVTHGKGIVSMVHIWNSYMYQTGIYCSSWSRNIFKYLKSRSSHRWLFTELLGTHTAYICVPVSSWWMMKRCNGLCQLCWTCSDSIQIYHLQPTVWRPQVTCVATFLSIKFDCIRLLVCFLFLPYNFFNAAQCPTRGCWRFICNEERYLTLHPTPSYNRYTLAGNIVGPLYHKL
jgi:hypothetical protein